MEAGRELDALVGEKVFGFWFDDDQWWGPHPGLPGEKAYASVCMLGHVWGPNITVRGLPKFSESIEAAWQVVEKMQSDGWRWTADRRGDDEFAVAWRFHRASQVHRADESTAPLAICLAALKACEAKEAK